MRGHKFIVSTFSSVLKWSEAEPYDRYCYQCLSLEVKHVLNHSPSFPPQATSDTGASIEKSADGYPNLERAVFKCSKNYLDVSNSSMREVYKCLCVRILHNINASFKMRGPASCHGTESSRVFSLSSMATKLQ